MKILKQSTAATINFGPALDPADGTTLKIGLAGAMQSATTGVKISKGGSLLNALHSPNVTYDAYGMYRILLDTTDTASLGRLFIIYAGDATVLPMKDQYTVVVANTLDSLINGSVFLKTDIAAINTVAGDAALLAANVEVDAIGTVSTAVNGAGSSTSFSVSDITEATANHYRGKMVEVQTGALAEQEWGVVTDSVLTNGETIFTVSPGSPTSEVLANGDKVLICS